MSKHKPHDFSAKIISWWYCTRCGLVTLKNEATKKAMNKTCPGKEDD